jgi:hypothetical protein
MKLRPATDPTSWLFQANIHGTYDPTPPQFADVWGTCQHGSFFFLSWHRMYLYFLVYGTQPAGGISSARHERQSAFCFRTAAEHQCRRSADCEPNQRDDGARVNCF